MRSFCVVLAEPNPLLSEKSAGLAVRYERVWCVTQVSTSEALERVVAALKPDVVFADWGLLQTLGTIAALRACAPSSRLVALADAVSAPYLSAAERLGLDAVIAKAMLAEELQSLIRRSDEAEGAEDDPARAPPSSPVDAVVRARSR